MNFGKNNDEYLEVDYSPYNGFLVRVESDMSDNMRVSVIEPREISIYQEQLSSCRLIDCDKFSLFGEIDGDFFISLKADTTISEAIGLANTFKYESRLLDIELLRSFLPVSFTNYYNKKQTLCIKSLYDSVGLGLNESVEYTAVHEVPVNSINRKLLDSVVMPKKEDWKKDKYGNIFMCIVKIGFANLLIAGKNTASGINWIASFNEVEIKKAVSAKTIEVVYV